MSVDNPQRRLRPLAGGLTIALLLGSAVAAYGQQPDLSSRPSRQLVISLSDGRLSLAAEAVPLREVLQRLAEKSGMSMVLQGDIAGSVSQSIVGLPLDLAIARLLGAERLSYVLEYAPAVSAGVAPKPTRLTVISSVPAGTLEIVAPAPAPVTIKDPDGQAEQRLEDDQEAIDALEEILLEEGEDPLVREAMLEALSEIENTEPDE